MYDDRGVVWAIEKSVLYAYKCCRCCCSVCCYYCFCFSLCHVETVCGFTTEYLDLLDIVIVLYAAAWRTSMHLHIPAMYFSCCYSVVCCYTAVAAAAATCCCCSSTCAGWQNLLPLLLHLIPLFSFSSFKNDLFSMYPLAVLRRTYSFDFLPTV